MTSLPKPDQSPSEGARDRATEGGTHNINPPQNLSDIQSYSDGEVASLGAFHTDESTLPVASTERFHTFNSYDDLFDYLANGGLTMFDSGGGTIPNPIVNIVKYVDPDDADYYHYQVWINEDSQDV